MSLAMPADCVCIGGEEAGSVKLSDYARRRSERLITLFCVIASIVLRVWNMKIEIIVGK